MGQTQTSHDGAPPTPAPPLTPRCGRAVARVAQVLDEGGWSVFESCDDDFTGVVSIAEIREKFVEVLRDVSSKSSLSAPALDAFLMKADRGDGFGDHGGWKLLREAVRVLAAQHTVEIPTGHPQGRLVVLPPGALARDGAARDAPRTAKLRTGTILLSMGEKQTLNDGTRRIRVTWSVADESCEGWISSKNCALLAAPPVIEEQAPPRTPPRRLTTWLDRAAAASTGNPARARPDALLLEGNARFLGRFSPERQQYLARKLERVLTPRTPSRESLSGLSPEGSPRPKADWTPRRRLRFYGRRLADDSLSDAQIRRLREGLLGEYGAAWRRDREKDVATCLAKAATDLRDGAMGELWRPAGRAGRPTRRYVLARLLHAIELIQAPDPALVTPSRVERVARGVVEASTRDLLLLSRWASAEHVRASAAVKSWRAHTKPRMVVPPTFLERQALDALVSVATSSGIGIQAALPDSAKDIRTAIAERFDRITRSRVLAELPAPNRVWCVSDLYIDVPLNLERCLAFEARPDDCLIVAGDVCSEPLLFEKFMDSVVRKFQYVFYVPGNHDLWCLSEGDLASDSLTKIFRQLLVCDRLGVITHSVRFSNDVCIVPLLSWYDPAFVSGASEDWIKGFDPFCRWPDYLGGDAGVAQFLASLNESSVDAVKGLENNIVLSFLHFLPQSCLFEGAGGCRSLGKVMGDARIEDQIRRLGSSVHVFGHSHIDVDCVLDGIRYVQHALGHPEDGSSAAYQPIVVWDAY